LTLSGPRWSSAAISRFVAPVLISASTARSRSLSASGPWAGTPGTSGVGCPRFSAAARTVRTMSALVAVGARKPTAPRLRSGAPALAAQRELSTTCSAGRASCSDRVRIAANGPTFETSTTATSGRCVAHSATAASRSAASMQRATHA
jgi:hypothetical protein